MDEIVNKVILKLEGKLSDEDLREVRDAMRAVMSGYQIQPMTTEVVPYEYQLPECYKMYIASKVMDGRMSERSRILYRDVLEKMLFKLQTPVEKITSNQLRAYILEMSIGPNGRKIAPATLNNRKSIIRSFFQWLTEEEYIDKDPSLRLHQERVNRKPEPIFTDMQIEQIRSACTCERDLAIIDFLVSSGVRITECCELKMADLDLDHREAVVYGKGGKYRTVYFDARAEFSLRRYLKSKSAVTEYVFTINRAPHTACTRQGVAKVLRDLGKATGISGIHPHRFRHTMATNLVEKGCDIIDVQKMLGHTKLDTTMRYTHTSKSKVKAAHERYAG